MGPMPFVEFTIIKLSAHAYQITLDDHQTVDPNVLWTPIVQQRWLVYAINVKVLVMEHADQMLTAQFSTIELIVFVMKVSSAIHLAVVVELFYVSINQFQVHVYKCNGTEFEIHSFSHFGFPLILYNMFMKCEQLIEMLSPVFILR